jgi:putative transposase
MQDYDSLNHTRWECKYHIVWIPKYRRKELYGTIRIYLGEEIRKLAREQGCEIEEGHIMPD